MSSSRYVGRHGSPRRPRPRLPLPSVGGSGIGRTAAKSVAGVGIVLGCGAFVIAPTSAVGSAGSVTGALGVNETSASDLFADPDATSARSAERSAPAAVSAPSMTKGADQGSVGELGVDAVAQPKAKPKPVEKDESESEEPEEESADEVTEEPEETQEQADASRPEETRSSRSSSRSESPSTGGDGGAPSTGNYAAEASALGLAPNAQAVYSAVRTEFPDMTDIGGYRAGDGGDHGSGHAVDVMVTGSRGDQIAAWLQQNASSLNIKYVIWKQRIWHPGGGWEPMEDRGDPTQNHFDHVHVSVN